MEKAKHILLICKSMPWRFKGGIQTHTWELAQALVKQGQKVSVLTGGRFRNPIHRYQKSGVDFIEIPFFPGRYIKPIAFVAEEFCFNWQAKQWVKRNHDQFDIIHIQGRSGQLLITDQALRSKLITTFHGLITKEYSNRNPFDINGRMHRWLTQKFEQKLVAHSKQSIAVSESLISDIQEQSPHSKNILLIPNGVKSQPKVEIDKSRDIVRFLFVGRLHQVKGLDKIIENFRHSKPYVHLDIIGDGPMMQTWFERVKMLGFQDRINFWGAMDNDNIMKILPSYQALLLPSDYETQGIVLLEANAQSVPVIASDLPAIRESVVHGYNGLLCNPQDGKEFIYTMNYLAMDHGFASKLGANGFHHVQRHFSWDKIAQQTLSTYQKIAS